MKMDRIWRMVSSNRASSPSPRRSSNDEDYELLASDRDSLPTSTTGHNRRRSYRAAPHQKSRGKAILHFFTLRRLLFAVACIPLLLIIGVLWSGIPPSYSDVRGYERALPQHNLVKAKERGDRYLRFPGHLWGHGLNNVLQEALLLSHLAHVSNRSYVFEDYVWSHFPLPWTIYDFALRPTRVPLNAFVSGFTAGGPINSLSSSSDSQPYSPLSVSAEFYAQVCPPSRVYVLHAHDAPSDVEGSVLVDWWREKIAGAGDQMCIEVDEGGKAVFDKFLFGSPRINSLFPALFDSPTLSSFLWSPLVHSAVSRNAYILRPSSGPSSLYTAHSSPHKNPRSTLPSNSTDFSLSLRAPSTNNGEVIKGLVAIHLRRGDYKRHCPRLAGWRSGYMGVNQHSSLPDRFNWETALSSFVSASRLRAFRSSRDGNPENGEPSEEEKEKFILDYYLEHCLPTHEQIAARLNELRKERPNLERVYVLTNAWGFWLNGLKSILLEPPSTTEKTVFHPEGQRSESDDAQKVGGWRDLIGSLDLLDAGWMDAEQRGVEMAVDMAIAERAEVFVGNGFSSLSSNIVMLRMARGLEPSSNRFL